MQNDERTFAHGCNSMEDSVCPAVAAGRNPDNFPYGEAAEEYDHAAEQQTGERVGKLSEETARECWLEALEMCRQRVKMADRSGLKVRREKILGATEEIAEELDWL